MPIPDKDSARPASTGKPDAEDDRLRYRVPGPPADHSVTVNQEDGTFTYTPSLDAEDPDQP